MTSQHRIRLVHFTSGAFDFLAIPLANELTELCDFFLILNYFHDGKDRPPTDHLEGFLKKSVKARILHRKGRRRNPVQFFYDCDLFSRIVRFVPDVVLIEGVESPYFLCFYVLMKLLGIHLVFQMHDVTPHSGSENNIVDWFGRLAVRMCDSVVVFSEDQQREFSLRFGRHASVLHLVQPSFYEEYCRPHTIQRERWTILFFGTIRPNKGLDLLIQAAEIARQRIPLLKVIIAGSCSNFAPYDRFIVTPAMFELHLERVPNHEVGRYFLRSQCSILPYRDATQSGSLLLSLSFNCPVIAAEVGGLPEYLSVGSSGLLFEKDSVSDLADKIAGLLLDEERLRNMQTYSRIWLRERFSPAAIADEVMTLVGHL